MAEVLSLQHSVPMQDLHRVHMAEVPSLYSILCTSTRSQSPHGRGLVPTVLSVQVSTRSRSPHGRGLVPTAFSVPLQDNRVHMAEVLSLSMQSLPSVDYSSALSPRSFNFMCVGVLEMLQVFREPMSTLPSPQQRPLWPVPFSNNLHWQKDLG